MGADLTHDDAGTSRPGIGRRTLIRRAAAAGAVAWTAPVILDSLSSPAAAVTGCSSCLRFGFVASGGDCATTTSTDDFPPKNGGDVCEASPCASTTDLAKGRSFSSLCFSLTGNCDFTAGGTATALITSSCTPTGCTASPAFLAASMSWLTVGGTSCTQAPPADTASPGIASFSPTQVIFNIPTDAKSQKSGAFQFVICCT